MGTDGKEARESKVVRVDGEDPPAFSCAVCQWRPGYSGTAGTLIWAVITHWLRTHWDGINDASKPVEADGDG